MNYRAEVDGLRAIAVFPVILFHAGFETFQGGFIGVDVFFVISGYLITTIILAELEQKKFSLAQFYERRARRILPAQFFVMFVCIFFAWVGLLPNQLKDFSQSLISVSIFASNILFWRTSGYFDTAAELKPLLHTWSLAVEEQYYMLFPLFLMFGWRWGKNFVLTVLIAIAIASFALAQWGSIAKPSAAFFLLPMRGWELLIGSFAAFHLSNKNRVSFGRWPHEIGAAIGLVLIYYAVVVYSKSTPFPGVYALVPTVGAVLIILFGTRETIIGKVLSQRIFVRIGLISYSAYLWHQPLFAFARQYRLESPTKLTLGSLAVCSLVIAFFSWKYVEAPFREKLKFSRVQIFELGTLGTAFFLSAGILGYLTNGFINSSRWNDIRAAQETISQTASGFKFCIKNRIKHKFPDSLACVIGDPNVEPEGVLWGDSFAGSLLFGINEQLALQGRSFYAVLSDGCIPVIGVSRASLDFDCNESRHRNFVKEFIKDTTLKKLVWVGNFGGLTGVRPDPDYVLDLQAFSQEAVLTRILENAQELATAGKSVVFVSNTPSFPKPAALFVSKSYMHGIPTVDSVQRIAKSVLVHEYGLNKTFFNQLAKANAIIVDGLEVFCVDGLCETHDKAGNLLFVDKGHISHFASIILAKQVLAKLPRNRKNTMQTRQLSLRPSPKVD